MREIPNELLIEDTLTTKPRFRSEYGKDAIRELLLHFSELGPHLSSCSSLDLNCLISACELRRIQKSDEYIAKKGDVIYSCYIILKGHEYLNSSNSSETFQNGNLMFKNDQKMTRDTLVDL